MSVILETTLGDLTIDLHITERPRTCLNFLKLCKIKYYNYCLFHKVEHNFSAQTGDPDGTGRGGESIFSHLYGDQAKYFDAEIKPRLKHTEIGTVSMTNNGHNMHASQFFITLGEELDYLDGEHTVFGQVVEGLETLKKLNETICDSDHRPYQDIRISHTVVLDDPFDDPPGLRVPDMSPELTEEQLRSTGRIAPDEEIDDTKGKSMEQIEEEIQDKEAKARATILEMVGDIPDAEVAPPDNVLFVCKLNPVTTADDLEIIFARFGTIKSCEVIKDKKSGESLQYSFIEFEKPEDCENAYFKMDNVLIDDRRIHVDFSQSVSKLSHQELRQHAKKPQFQLKEKLAASKASKNYDLVFEDEPKVSYKDIKKQIRQEEKGFDIQDNKKYVSEKNTKKETTEINKRNNSRERKKNKINEKAIKGLRTRSSSTSSSSSSSDRAERKRKITSDSSVKHKSKVESSKKRKSSKEKPERSRPLKKKRGERKRHSSSKSSTERKKTQVKERRSRTDSHSSSGKRQRRSRSMESPNERWRRPSFDRSRRDEGNLIKSRYDRSNRRSPERHCRNVIETKRSSEKSRRRSRSRSVDRRQIKKSFNNEISRDSNSFSRGGRDSNIRRRRSPSLDKRRRSQSLDRRRKRSSSSDSSSKYRREKETKRASTKRNYQR